MRIKHNKHEKIFKIQKGKRVFLVAFDTFGCPENHDRLLANIIRIIGIFGLIWVFIANSYYLIPALIIFAVMAGVTKLRYFQNKPKRLEFMAWR